MGLEITIAVSPNRSKWIPFESSTAIRYAGREGARLEVAVYDVHGRRVRALFEGHVPAGPHDFAWNGRDDSGRRVAAGVYLCRFRMDDGVRTKRLVLVK